MKGVIAAVAVVGILVALIVIVIAAYQLLLAPSVSKRRDVKADRNARWERYSHPVGEGFEDWEVGVVLYRSGGPKRQTVKRWKGRHPTLVERSAAELDADTRALEYNTSGWRPWD